MRYKRPLCILEFGRAQHVWCLCGMTIWKQIRGVVAYGTGDELINLFAGSLCQLG